MFEKSLTKKMQDVVLEGKIPAKEVCSKIKKPYSTLLRELNPFDTHAKLGAETLFEIVKATRNVSVLEFMAGELGYTLQPCERPVHEEKRRSSSGEAQPAMHAAL